MPRAQERVQVRRRPHGQQNARRVVGAVNENLGRDRQALGTSEALTTPRNRWALGISLLLLFVSMGLVIYVGDYIDLNKYKLNFYNYLNDEKMNSSAKILIKLVDDCERLKTIEAEYFAISNLNAIVSTVKAKLQPIQNEITSLTAQTRKYEEMDRSKYTRPQQFISSVQQQLDKLEERLENEYDTELNEILAKDSIVATQLREDFISMVEEGHFILDVLHDPNLIHDKINIVPPPEIDAIDGGKYIDRLIVQHDFDKVLDIVRNLVPMLERRDFLVPKVIYMESKLGITDKEDFNQFTEDLLRASESHPKEVEELTNFLEELDYVAMKVEDYINENVTYIQLLLPHHSILSTAVAEKMEQFNTHDKAKRDAYLDLRRTIVNSIDHLRTRLQKL